MAVCPVCQQRNIGVCRDENDKIIRLTVHKFAGEWCDGDRQLPQTIEPQDVTGSRWTPKNLYRFCKGIEIDCGDLGGKNYHETERALSMKLCEKGYLVGHWITGERDSFGPLSRFVDIMDVRTGEVTWYMYG